MDTSAGSPGVSVERRQAYFQAGGKQHTRADRKIGRVPPAARYGTTQTFEDVPGSPTFSSG